MPLAIHPVCNPSSLPSLRHASKPGALPLLCVFRAQAALQDYLKMILDFEPFPALLMASFFMFFIPITEAFLARSREFTNIRPVFQRTHAFRNTAARGNWHHRSRCDFCS